MSEQTSVIDEFEEIVRGLAEPDATVVDSQAEAALIEPFGVSMLKEIGNITMTETAVIRASYQSCCEIDCIVGGKIKTDTTKDDPKDDE